jgi:hypothetical protein
MVLKQRILICKIQKAISKHLALENSFYFWWCGDPDDAYNM